MATMIGDLPVLNWSKTQSRSFCCLSPCIAKELGGGSLENFIHQI